MRRTSLWVSAVLFLVSLSLVLPVPQDAGATILVTGGSLDVASSTGLDAQLSLTSDERGFSFFGITGLGVFDPGDPFRPGDTISLRAEWSGMDLDGAFTIDGVGYGMGSINFPLSCTSISISFPFPICGNGSVDFFGRTVAPPVDSLTSTVVKVPFTFSGFINYVTPSTAPPPAIAKETLTGGGTATINLTRIDISPSLSVWDFSSASYDFQTPEPSTLLLVGSGLVGLGGLAWRRSRKG